MDVESKLSLALSWSISVVINLKTTVICQLDDFRTEKREIKCSTLKPKLPIHFFFKISSLNHKTPRTAHNYTDFFYLRKLQF